MKTIHLKEKTNNLVMPWCFQSHFTKIVSISTHVYCCGFVFRDNEMIWECQNLKIAIHGLTARLRFGAPPPPLITKIYN